MDPFSFVFFQVAQVLYFFFKRTDLNLSTSVFERTLPKLSTNNAFSLPNPLKLMRPNQSAPNRKPAVIKRKQVVKKIESNIW